MLLLVFTALGLVTFVTWRLLIAAADARMQDELRFEMQQFAEFVDAWGQPADGYAVRRVGAVPGTKGLSLFMVPKFLPDPRQRTPASATACSSPASSTRWA